VKHFNLTGIRFFLAIQVFTTTLVLFTGILAIEIGSLKLNDSLKSQAFFTYSHALREVFGIEKVKKGGEENPVLYPFQVNRAIWAMRLVVFIGGIVASISGIVLSFQIRKPIKNLIKGVSQVAKGDFSKRVKLSISDHVNEFAPLVKAYNEMVDNLNQSEEKLKKVFYAADDAIIVTDSMGKISMWSGGSTRLFGFSQEEIAGVSVENLIAVDNPEEFLQIIHKGAISDSKWKGEVFYRSKGGEIFPGWCIATYLKDDQGKVAGFLHVIRDMTERRQMEMQLLQSEKLASVGELAAGVAHEINNPLSGILSNAEFLQEEIPEEEVERHEEIREIISNTERIRTIVRDLLNFSRQRDSEMKRMVSIYSILDSSLNLTGHQMELDNIKIIKDYHEGLPSLLASPNQIEQVFINIINNARYALNKKFPENHDEKVLKISTSLHSENGKKYIRTEFYDQGTGIPKRYLHMITKPFFTTKEAGKGTGLGLSISENIVREHGGKISFESEEGRFTRVIIDLPVYEGDGDDL
jgi:PAS domain S-box-containing protein